MMSSARRFLVLCVLSLLAVARSAPAARAQGFVLAGAGPGGSPGPRASPGMAEDTVERG